MSTPVEIFGTPEAQNCAKKKIDELTEDLTLKRIRETEENSKKQMTVSRYGFH